MRTRTWLVAALALLLVACAGEPISRRPYPQPKQVPVPRSTPPTAPRPPALPPAPASEQDRPPAPGEVPPDVGTIPDAVPEPVEKSRWGNPDNYEVFGVRYDVLPEATGFKQRGHASWYGKKFHGRRTSSGELYDMFAMTGAHKTLPIPTYAKVTNLENGKSVVVRINDRGPFHKGRIVDLSYSAAHKIGIIGHGSGEVELEVVEASPVVAQAKPVVARPVVPPTPIPVSGPSMAATPSPPAVAVPVSRQVQPRFLQAGSFGDSRNAATFRERLAVAGIRPLLMKSEVRHGKWLYRVLVGPLDSPAEMNAMRRKLADDDTTSIPVHE